MYEESIYISAIRVDWSLQIRFSLINKRTYIRCQKNSMQSWKLFHGQVLYTSNSCTAVSKPFPNNMKNQMHSHYCVSLYLINRSCYIQHARWPFLLNSKGIHVKCQNPIDIQTFLKHFLSKWKAEEGAI